MDNPVQNIAFHLPAIFSSHTQPLATSSYQHQYAYRLFPYPCRLPQPSPSSSKKRSKSCSPLQLPHLLSMSKFMSMSLDSSHNEGFHGNDENSSVDSPTSSSSSSFASRPNFLESLRDFQTEEGGPFTIDLWLASLSDHQLEFLREFVQSVCTHIMKNASTSHKDENVVEIMNMAIYSCNREQEDRIKMAAATGQQVDPWNLTLKEAAGMPNTINVFACMEWMRRKNWLTFNNLTLRHSSKVDLFLTERGKVEAFASDDNLVQAIANLVRSKS